MCSDINEKCTSKPGVPGFPTDFPLISGKNHFGIEQSNRKNHKTKPDKIANIAINAFKTKSNCGQGFRDRSAD